jgi:hypothetical protein
MRYRKVYGQSKIDNCPFCGKRALSKSGQGIPVCVEHKESEILDLKCVCGEWLDVCSGKFGPYFRCMRCGNINFNKALEINPDWRDKAEHKDPKVAKPNGVSLFKPKKMENEAEKKKVGKKEYVVDSDEIDWIFG